MTSARRGATAHAQRRRMESFFMVTLVKAAKETLNKGKFSNFGVC
jgi:hypothetical protein